MGKPIYAATSATKEIAEDHPTEGESLVRTCTMSEAITIQSDTLRGLIDRIGIRYGLAMDDLFIAADDGEPVTGFDFDRYETASCDEPSAREIEQWQAGKFRIWHAIYSFTIEKRSIEPIDFAEFQEAGIQTH